MPEAALSFSLRLAVNADPGLYAMRLQRLHAIVAAGDPVPHHRRKAHAALRELPIERIMMKGQLLLLYEVHLIGHLTGDLLPPDPFDCGAVALAADVVELCDLGMVHEQIHVTAASCRWQLRAFLRVLRRQQTGQRRHWLRSRCAGRQHPGTRADQGVPPHNELPPV